MARPGPDSPSSVTDRPSNVANGRENPSTATDPETASRTDPAVTYATDVVAAGPLVADFRSQGVFIFFGEQAPAELHEFVLLHRPRLVGPPPAPGDLIELDGELFAITAVGHVVEQNLRELGHFALKADGSTVAPLPGDVCVEARPLPLLAAASTMRILRPAPDHGPTLPASEPAAPEASSGEANPARTEESR